MRNLLIAIVVFWSASVLSKDLNDQTVKSTHVNLSGGYYFSTIETMVDPEKCGSKSWYKLANERFSKEAFELVLAAQMHGKKVNFIIDGCFGEYPKVPYINISG